LRFKLTRNFTFPILPSVLCQTRISTH